MLVYITMRSLNVCAHEAAETATVSSGSLGF